ncbi:MAG: hypothetical protein Q9198_002730, partial [Flavoplaca austrocitrina]
MISSSRSSIVSPQDQPGSAWHFVNIDKASTPGPGQANTAGLPPIKRHRRGQTEGPRRLSMFRSRSRTNTVSNLTMGHRLSPSVSVESSHVEYEQEDRHPQSSWSDSDHSDGPSKSWVARGSKMLKKKNSKFALAYSKTAEWEEEDCPAPDDQSCRNSNKHGRMRSTGDGFPNRPQISKPYNFQHLTHTQPRHFPAVRSTSQDKLITDFFAINASQPPQKHLRGIRVADIRIHRDPITPPMISPTKSSASRPSSVVSVGNSGTISRSRSSDNFSQPSPKTYRFPRSPTSPPPRNSSRNATHAAPDFFSDQHHATVEERELLSRCEASTQCAIGEQPSTIATAYPYHQTYDDAFLPHAITTPDDLAFTLQPPMLRRSTLALADVPEEDELHSIKRSSMESSRPMTADSILRHAKSFPTNRRSKHRRNASSSSKSIGRPDSIAIDASLAQDAMYSTDAEESVPILTSCRKSPRSMGIKGTGACWEDDIDYCYQLEAEADCDFEWDRASMNGMRLAAQPNDKLTSAEDGPESAGSLSGSYEMLRSQNPEQNTMDEHVEPESDSQRLPRLQTSLPDLEFSAASSAKSSMASLHGPITPLQQLPSPGKGKTALRSSKSTDTLNLVSSFFVAHDCHVPWSYDDVPQKETQLSRDHSSISSQKSHLAPNRSRKSSSARSSGPLLSRYPSSESIMHSNSTSAVLTRGTTVSGGSLNDIACSKNYRQHMEITTKQIADRLAALSVADSQESSSGQIAAPNSSANQLHNSSHPLAHSRASSDLTSFTSPSHGEDQAWAIPRPLTTQDK